MLWTIALMSTGIGGLWIVGKHWYGWLLYLLNEVLWFAYAVSISATPLMLMAVVWAIVGARNCYVNYQREHPPATVEMSISQPGHRRPTIHEMQMMSPETWDRLHGPSDDGPKPGWD